MVLGVRSPGRLNWILCSGSYKADIKMSTRLDSYLEAWENNPVGSSLGLLAEFNSLQPRSTFCSNKITLFLPMRLFYLQSIQSFSSFESLWLPILPLARESSLFLKAHVIRLGPPIIKVNWAIWYNYWNENSSHSQVLEIWKYNLGDHSKKFCLPHSLLLRRGQDGIHYLVQSFCN